MSDTCIEFVCLGSSSSGNCFIFKKHNECVMVECGFDYKVLIKKLLGQNISLTQIKCCCCTHEHSDHTKSLQFLLNAGIPVYATKTSFKGNSLGGTIIDDDKTYSLCSWLKMRAFKVNHDCESYGFIFFDTENKESILFINDTKFFDFKYKQYSYDYIFIECNHIQSQLEAIMQRCLDNGKDVIKYKRQTASHMSLSALKLFLDRMNIEKTKGIFLMHLSQEVCNDIIVKTEIKGVYQKPTFVCYKNGGIN